MTAGSPSSVELDASGEALGPLTDDAFLGGALHLLQPKNGHRAGIDAVFLAAAVPVEGRSGERILDAGSGSGVVGLAVVARMPDVTLTGVEMVAEMAALAARNAERNGLSDRARFLACDLRAPLSTLADLGLSTGGYDHVVANPPYFVDDAVRRAPAPLKDQANVMAGDDLERWIRFLTAVTGSGGSLTLVHRAEALGELLRHLEGRFGDILVHPLFPRSGTPASRILVQGRKGSRSPMKLLPGMVLHGADGHFTPEAENILRHGAALNLSGFKTGKGA